MRTFLLFLFCFFSTFSQEIFASSNQRSAFNRLPSIPELSSDSISYNVLGSDSFCGEIRQYSCPLYFQKEKINPYVKVIGIKKPDSFFTFHYSSKTTTEDVKKEFKKMYPDVSDVSLRVLDTVEVGKRYPHFVYGLIPQHENKRMLRLGLYPMHIVAKIND